MAQKIAVGIDIGTYQIKVLVAEALTSKERLQPKVLGVGFAESRGLRHGYILNKQDTIKSLRYAIRQAEKSSGIRIRKAYISVGGISLSGFISSGSTVITRADSEVTELDVESVINTCEQEMPKSLIINRKIIHTVPIQFRIDGMTVLGRPEGMKGVKLEAKALIITSLEQHLNDLIEAVEEAGVEVEDVVASPIAASLVTLNKLQKIAGSVLANIGAETVSIVVFENNIPVSLEVFPIGSNDITNDIALGLKIAIEEAEEIKTGLLNGSSYSKKKLGDIIGARLTDIFELIESHLKKIGRSGLLPAGIIITGGGSGLGDIEEFAKFTLKLPSKIASVNFSLKGKSEIRDATWAVAYGLCIIALNGGDGESIGLKAARNTRSNIIKWIKQFLP